VTGGVIDAVFQAVDEAEKNFKALVLWQPEGPFCAGANLLEIVKAVQSGELDRIRAIVSKFQQATSALRYSFVPTIAAVQGLALGGGCEIMMHCDRIVAALETYSGLVEIGVGVIPAGGGTKELVLRAAEDAKGGEIFPHLARYFEQVAMAKVSGSALEAREMGYLRPGDPVVPNPHEILFVAKREAESLYEAAYRPPRPAKNVPVLGKTGMATLQAQLVNFLEGGFISEHDLEIGKQLTRILCGGEVDAGQRVDDKWLLRLEHDAFMDLVKTEKTQARIQHMLEKGKPLRN
jgi:3-hydroxyacyl-CoA dehydrogenase